MKRISDNTPKTDLTIQGIIFKAPTPYKEGDVLDAEEAGALNQTFTENLRNNFAATIRKKLETLAKERGVEASTLQPSSVLDLEALRGEFDEYAKDYEFGARRGSRILDPVERELRDMAIEMVKSALRTKGIKLNSVSQEKMDELATGLIEKRPDLRAEAERRVESTKVVALDELGVDLTNVGEANGEGETEEEGEKVNDPNGAFTGDSTE